VGNAKPSKAVIFGCSGPALTDDERRFFEESLPAGFILFERNCQDPDQVRGLVGELRETVNHPNAPVLIDQEGGRVQRLKLDLPHLEIVINGGIHDLDQAAALLDGLDGVMLGRAAYHRPWLLAEAMPKLFGVPPPFPTRTQVVRALYPFIEGELAAGVPLRRITRHLLGLFHGCPGGRRWRGVLSTQAQRPGAGLEVLDQALAQVSEESLL